MDLSFLSQFVDSSKLAGWVRASVASLIGLMIAKWPWLSAYLDPTTQAALGVFVSGVVVGVWSQLTKTDASKIAAVTAMPDVAKVLPKPNAAPDSAVAIAAADPAQPKVVTQ